MSVAHTAYTNTYRILVGEAHIVYYNTVALTFHRGHAASSDTSPAVLHHAQVDPALHQCVSNGARGKELRVKFGKEGEQNEGRKGPGRGKRWLV